MERAEVTVIEAPALSKGRDKRYVVVDKESGEVIDDAQGYGYKSAQKAYAAYNYKTRDKSKDREKAKKKKQVLIWLKEHPDFAEAMDQYAIEVEKGMHGPEEKFNARFVGKMLKDNGLDPDFTARDLLKAWEGK